MTRLRHRLDGPADGPVVVFSNAIGFSSALAELLTSEVAA